MPKTHFALRASIALLTVAITSVFVGGCLLNPGTPEPTDGLLGNLKPAEQKVITASNEFAFDLLKELHQEKPAENLFMSPLSASMALRMTLNGAVGTTYDGMVKALRFGDLTQDEINESYRSLIDMFSGLDPLVTFQIANSIWYKDNFPFETSFLEQGRTFFGAEIRGLDFLNPVSVDIINDWVDAKTNHKIPEIIKVIPRDAVMYLINAIYFNGTWTTAFDANNTRERAFYLESGSSVAVPTMTLADILLYSETDQYQAVDLAYGSGAYSMTVVLPKADVTTDDLISLLDSDTWATWTAGFDRQEIDLYLPKFTLKWESELNDPLKRMGMPEAFLPGGADFTRMSPEGKKLYISMVLQKTFLDVYEEGTEAAAVTVVEVSFVTCACGGPSRPVMRVNRPFLMAIRERTTGTLMFLGKIMNPAAG